MANTVALSSIADAVIEIAERPDFSVDQASFQLLLKRALRRAHGIAFFTRDLQYADDVVVPAMASSAEIILPDNYRDCQSIQLRDSFGERVPLDFVQETDSSVVDYFGYRKPATYRKFGDTITANWLHSLANEASLRMAYFKWPTISCDMDDPSEDYEDDEAVLVSDSFIAKHYEEIIVFEALKLLNIVVDNAIASKYANLADEAILTLLDSEETYNALRS